LNFGCFTFSRKRGSPQSEEAEAKEFTHGLTYVADVFGHLNDLNLSIQSPAVTIINVVGKLRSPSAKLPL
jgi:hypothetical protein